MSTEAKDTARTEAFSDGVFAIAITLLVLELKVPHGHDGPLAARLLAQWPEYVAFLNSFATIGIMWMNHHHLFSLIRKVDHGLTLWNLGLLLGVSFVPFPTATLAEHMDGADGRTAALFYGGTFFVIALLFNGFWRHVTSEDRAATLLRHAREHEAVQAVSARYWIGPSAYLLATVLAFWSARATLGLSLLLAIWFAIPLRTSK